MYLSTCLRAGIAAAGIAIVGIAATVAAPEAAAAEAGARPTTSRDVRLASATVPVGGLVASFLGNQVVYCSIICPLLVETAVTPVVGTLLAPATFLNAASAGDLLKAIGETAASVTGPTNAAAEAAIAADGSIPAPRALNAFEVGVVGLLDVIPAARGGVPGVVSAIEAAREDTFTALNLPIVANPTPTVAPHGVEEAAVVGALNIGGAVIFPAFNHILAGVFETPNAVAQELATTGDPLRAGLAGVNAAAGEASAAVSVIAQSAVTAINDTGAVARNTKRTTATTDTSHPLRSLVSNLRQSVRSAVSASDSKKDDTKRSDSKRTSDRPHRAARAG